MVTDIAVNELDDGKQRIAAKQQREGAEPLPRLCPECKAVISRQAKVCAHCGTLFFAKTQVHAIDGDLVEYGSGESGKRTASMAEKAQFFAELQWVARERGYQTGWAANQYRMRFGVWPNDPRIRYAGSASPTLATRNWLKSRAIAWAKGRRAYG